MEEEEPLSILFQEESCPTLSPRVETLEPPKAPNSPSHNSSISDDPEKILSEDTATSVNKLQRLIEDKVDDIVTSDGYEENLSPESRRVLGQWVHGESTNIETLRGMKADLDLNGDKSQDFLEAVKALVDKFLD